MCIHKHQAPLLSLRKIFRFKGDWLKQIRRKVIRTYLVVCIKEGSGELTIDGINHKIDKNKLFILTPGMIVDVWIDICIPLEVYYLAFTVSMPIKQNRASPINEMEKLPLIYSGEVEVQNWIQVDDAMRWLSDESDDNGDMYRWKQRLVFEGLLYMLMQDAKTSSQNSDWEHILKHSADYMNRSYAEDIKIARIAQLYGLNPSTYSRLFKKTFGMLPSDYLTSIRIERAKEMLQQEKRMREISQNTGFCDEYYFSRTFKKIVGVSPSNYAKSTRNQEAGKAGKSLALESVRVAVTYIDEVDHLIALGLMPIAVPNDHTMDRSENTIPYLKQYVQYAQKIGCEQTVRKDLLSKLNPDMIIAGRFLRDWGVTGLEEIAKTHYYFWEVDWRNTHRELAKILRQEARAERNIRQFDHEVRLARDQMLKKCSRRKFVFLETTEQGIRVSPYTSNGGWLLYQQLGLAPASAVTIDQWDHFISPEEVAEIQADYVLVGRRSGSQQAYRQLFAHAAVQERKVLEVPRYPWAKGGPIAYSEGVKHLLSLFENIHK